MFVHSERVESDMKCVTIIAHDITIRLALPGLLIIQEPAEVGR
jgi:hypothetical protein